MIARLRGKLLSLEPQRAVVEAAGVGYDVLIGSATFAALQARPREQEAELHVHSHWKDGELSLYGFERLLEKRLFDRLTAVSGVGPSIGLAILSAQRAEDLVASLAAGDGSLLERVPRVGKKLASRIVLEISGKLKDLAAEASVAASPAREPWADLVSALCNLGYRRGDAERAAREVQGESAAEPEFSEALRRALALLASR